MPGSFGTGWAAPRGSASPPLACWAALPWCCAIARRRARRCGCWSWLGCRRARWRCCCGGCRWAMRGCCGTGCRRSGSPCSPSRCCRPWRPAAGVCWPPCRWLGWRPGWAGRARRGWPSCRPATTAGPSSPPRRWAPAPGSPCGPCRARPSNGRRWRRCSASRRRTPRYRWPAPPGGCRANSNTCYRAAGSSTTSSRPRPAPPARRW